jgi:hypothetical protein
MIYRRFRGPRNLMQTGLQISQAEDVNQQNGILTHPRHRRHLLKTACDPRCTPSIHKRWHSALRGKEGSYSLPIPLHLGSDSNSRPLANHDHTFDVRFLITLGRRNDHR